MNKLNPSAGASNYPGSTCLPKVFEVLLTMWTPCFNNAGTFPWSPGFHAPACSCVRHEIPCRSQVCSNLQDNSYLEIVSVPRQLMAIQDKDISQTWLLWMDARKSDLWMTPRYEQIQILVAKNPKHRRTDMQIQKSQAAWCRSGSSAEVSRAETLVQLPSILTVLYCPVPSFARFTFASTTLRRDCHFILRLRCCWWFVPLVSLISAAPVQGWLHNINVAHDFRTTNGHHIHMRGYVRPAQFPPPHSVRSVEERNAAVGQQSSVRFREHPGPSYVEAVCIPQECSANDSRSSQNFQDSQYLGETASFAKQLWLLDWC